MEGRHRTRQPWIGVGCIPTILGISGGTGSGVRVLGAGGSLGLLLACTCRVGVGSKELQIGLVEWKKIDHLHHRPDQWIGGCHAQHPAMKFGQNRCTRVMEV